MRSQCCVSSSPWIRKTFKEFFFFFKHWHQLFWKEHTVPVSWTFWLKIVSFLVSLLVWLVTTKIIGIWESSVAEIPAAPPGLGVLSHISPLGWSLWQEQGQSSCGNTRPWRGAASGLGVIYTTLKLRSWCRHWMCWQSYKTSSQSTLGFIAVTTHNFLTPEPKPWMLNQALQTGVSGTKAWLRLEHD